MTRRWFLSGFGLLFLLLMGMPGASQEAPEARPCEQQGLSTSCEGEARVYRGKLGSLMTFLYEWAESEPTRSFGKVELFRRSDAPMEWNLAVTPSEKQESTPLGIGCLAFAHALETAPDELRFTRLSLQRRELALAGESLSFEAINSLRTGLPDSPGPVEAMDYPSASRRESVVVFSLQGVVRRRESWPGGWGRVRLEELVARLHGQLLLNELPKHPHSVQDVAFMGRIKSGGRTYAVTAFRDGKVRYFPVGYQFADGEILAVEPDGVKLRMGKPDSTEGEIVFIPLRRRQL